MAALGMKWVLLECLILVVEEVNQLFGDVIVGKRKDIVHLGLCEVVLYLAVVDIDVYNYAAGGVLLGGAGAASAAALQVSRLYFQIDIFPFSRDFKPDIQILYALFPYVVFQGAGYYLERVYIAGVKNKFVNHAHSQHGPVQESVSHLVEGLAEYSIPVGDIQVVRLVDEDAMGQGEERASICQDKRRHIDAFACRQGKIFLDSQLAGACDEGLKGQGELLYQPVAIVLEFGFFLLEQDSRANIDAVFDDVLRYVLYAKLIVHFSSSPKHCKKLLPGPVYNNSAIKSNKTKD